MKKAVLATTVAFLMTTSVFAANKVDLQVSNSHLEKWASTYLVLSVYNGEGKGVTTANILTNKNPSYLLDIGNFVSCASAEGQEICAKAGQSLPGVAGAFVAPVNAKDQEGNTKIDVYVDQVKYSTNISVGTTATAAAVSAPKTESPTVSSAQSESLSDVKSGASAHASAYLLLALLSTLAGTIFYKKASNS